MSRFAEVIVLALDACEVMEPLTRDDESRSWRGRFVPIDSQWPQTRRYHLPAPPTDEFPPSPGVLVRTDNIGHDQLQQTPEAGRDQRRAW
ncbi:hypothetical protein [Nocardia sp. NPDC050413]|uniref:hypothetical protein n=1 Tax=Nocardia sp. NPDC050413 TaxID=3155784 RepID=UPI0033E6FD49